METYRIRRFFQGRFPTILLALLSYAAAYLLIQELYRPRGETLPRTWSAGNPGKTQEIPFYTLVDAPTVIRLEQKLNYPIGSALVLPRVSGNRIVVSIDGNAISSIGAPGGTGNIWTGFHWIDLPDAYSERNTTLSIQILGAYDLGIRELPYVVKAHNHVLFRWLTNVLFGELYWLVVGVILALAALQSYYARIDRRLRKAYWLNTAGVLLGAFYLFDFAMRSDTGSLAFYLLARKLMLSAGYIAPLLMLMAIEVYTRKRTFLARFTTVSTLIAVGLVLYAPNLAQLKTLSVYAAGLAQLNWLCLFIIAYRTRHNVIVFAVAFFYFTLIGSMISMISSNSHIFMIQIGYVFAIVSVVYNMIEEFGRLHEDFRTAYKQSRTDPLTGAFNRFVMDEIVTGPGDSVVLIDMNDFKNINDKYGHQAGDRVLIEWVKSAQMHTHEGDMIIRTGGDEFVILVRKGNESDMGRVTEDFQLRLGDLPAAFAYGIETIETSLHDAIQNADQRMYSQKRKTRTTWIRSFLRKRLASSAGTK
ncbi:MAG: GGDEF domain-containing protein [Spirochaetia bacterium]|nr:GGDEF domain-containing protein [Spirochaetia bacterium]